MKTFRHLTKIFIVCSLFANLSGLTAQTKPIESIFTLPAGTKIRVRMDNEINSKVSSTNDTFTVTVAKSLVIRDVEVLPIGVVIEGKILNISPASSGKKDGKFEVIFETLKLADGAKRTIDGSLVNQDFFENKSSNFNLISILGGTAIGAIIGGISGKGKGLLIGVGIGAGVGTLTTQLKKGREARIKANEEFEIRLNKEVTLPASDF